MCREKEQDLSSDHPRIIYRKGSCFNPDGTPERTLSKYHRNIEASFNPICDSSGFINGIVKRADGKVEEGRGIMQNLLDIEGIRPEQIAQTTEQFYLQVERSTKTH